MAGKHSPLNVGVIKEKIEQGQVKVKATRNMAKKNTQKNTNKARARANIICFFAANNCLD